MLFCLIYYTYPCCLSCLTSRLPGHGYWVDTYYWTYPIPGSARTFIWTMVPPLVGRKASGQGCLRSLFHRVPCRWSMPPPLCPPSHVPGHGYQLDTYYWTFTIQVQPGPATGSWPSTVGRRYRETTRCYVMVVLLVLEFWGIEQKFIQNIWQLVFVVILALLKVTLLYACMHIYCYVWKILIIYSKCTCLSIQWWDTLVHYMHDTYWLYYIHYTGHAC